MNTILYSDNFRTALHSPITREHEHDLRCALHGLMLELLQHPNRKHDPNLQGMLSQCRLRLRTLQNLVDATRGEQEFAMQRCDLRCMLEDLCAAADLLLRPHNRSVIFSAPHERIELACAPRELTTLVLELIANAMLHTSGSEITVTMQRKTRAITITVESTGRVDLDKLHRHAQQTGSGTSAMLRTAWLHHGTLLWLQRNEKSVASLKLSTGLNRTQRSDEKLPTDLNSNSFESSYDSPDLVDLLADQCSVVYVGLAQVN
ncbi:MAG: hypothetical protein FWD06_07165 [Oscillospiraceae bacterium]|nr:hypothetical protein [Oscillospiraceae bacterium]